MSRVESLISQVHTFSDRECAFIRNLHVYYGFTGGGGSFTGRGRALTGGEGLFTGHGTAFTVRM